MKKTILCVLAILFLISYAYNDKGQLVSETDSASGTVKSYTYDSSGNVINMSVTRNDIVEINQAYVYDKLNRLTSVSENVSVIATYSYDNKNNRTQTVVTDGETTNYSYNIANMLTSQTTGDKLSETYSYYLNGNQKSKASNGQTTNYAYDSMNRLVSENDTQYTFDDFGNRLTMSDGEATTTYSYDLNNRLTESIEEDGDVTTTTNFFYDYNGNQITKAVMVNQPYTEGMSGDYTISNNSNNYVALYEYNCYNQLIGVDTNGVVSSYTYSPDGLRHSKTVGGNTTTFVYDNANVIEEITTDSTNKYYRGIEIIKNDDGLYYLYNGQGDVSALTDSNGTIVADYTFDAYGNQTTDNTIYNPFGYRGEYTDAESGLVYLRARMYDPQTGRFINEDPAHDGFNWYVYCGNNPVNLTDPWGLAPEWNESNDHWFALRYEIEDAGGSVSWNGNTRTATASVYGVSVDFKIGNVGVELRNGVTYVRADTFYSGVVNSATEMGFLGTHSVALGNYHTSTIMFVSKDSDYHGTTNFKDNVRWGDVQFATLGAGEGSGKLQSDINRTKDKNLDIKVSMQWLYSGIGTTKNLFTAESHYRTNYNNLNYDLFPTPGRTKWYGKGYNSNSFTAGLLNSVGFSPQTPSYKVPGWNKPLPASYFGF